MKEQTERTEKESDRKLVQKLKQWQSVEDDSLRTSKDLQSRTQNPFVRLLMEIIAHDSAMHRRVQQFIIDSIEKKSVSLEPKDLADIWEFIEEHGKAEKDVIALAKETKEHTDLFVPQYLLGYLLEDERKHDLLLHQFLENREYREN